MNEIIYQGLFVCFLLLLFHFILEFRSEKNARSEAFDGWTFLFVHSASEYRKRQNNGNLNQRTFVICFCCVLRYIRPEITIKPKLKSTPFCVHIILYIKASNNILHSAIYADAFYLKKWLNYWIEVHQLQFTIPGQKYLLGGIDAFEVDLEMEMNVAKQNWHSQGQDQTTRVNWGTPKNVTDGCH